MMDVWCADEVGWSWRRAFECSQYLCGRCWSGVMSSAVLDNREKVAKINAELARLELEMEMDHADSPVKALGSSWLPEILGGKKKKLKEKQNKIQKIKTKEMLYLKK